MPPVALPTLRMITCMLAALAKDGWIKQPIMWVPPPAGQGMNICTWAAAGAMDAIKPERASAARDRSFIAVFASLDGTLRALAGSLAQAVPPEQAEFAGSSDTV